MPHFIRTPNPHIKFCGPPIPHPHSQQIPSTNAMPINQPCVEAQASCIPVPEHQSLQPPKATKSKKESSKSKKAKNAIQQPSSPKSKMIADSRSPMNEINNVMPLSAPSETPCFKGLINSLLF
jgi:hypothetical protein